MKKYSYFGFVLLCCYQLKAQPTDVFYCNPENSIISNSDFTNTQTDIFKNCINFESTTLYEGNATQNKHFKAHYDIHITSDFHDKTEGGSSHHYSTANKADFDVAILNYWNADLVFKYDKLEIGNTLPNGVQEKVDNFINASLENYHPTNTDPTKINPFLEWEIKVETTFKHISTGFEKTIFGFYFQDYERNFQNEKWDELTTPYPFLTRYSPPKNGQWQAITKINVGEGSEIYLSEPYFFTVIESGQHGFVKVHENQRNLKLEDRMIMPVGHNMGWAGFGHDDASIDNISEVFQQWQTFQQDFLNYANGGSRFVRMHLHNRINDIEWEHVGNYSKRLHFAWELDKIIELTEDRDLLVQFTLMMQHQLAQIDETRFRWDFDGDWHGLSGTSDSNPPGYWAQLGLRNVVDYISNEESVKYLKQRMRYLISRYCYTTSIYQLDIHSEINLALASEDHYYSHLPSNTANHYYYSIDTRNKVYNYHIIMSDLSSNSKCDKLAIKWTLLE